jgi:hypothetical protein
MSKILNCYISLVSGVTILGGRGGGGGIWPDAVWGEINGKREKMKKCDKKRRGKKRGN